MAGPTAAIPCQSRQVNARQQVDDIAMAGQDCPEPGSTGIGDPWQVTLVPPGGTSSRVNLR